MANLLFSPKYEIVFRKLFGSAKNKRLLIALINSIVGRPFHVVDIVIKNPYNFADYVDSKSTILDIKALADDGTWYDIELQISEQSFYGKRALFYATKLFVDQLTEGAKFSSLNMTIGIHFIDFDFFPDKHAVRYFDLRDSRTRKTNKKLDYIRLYFIEMNKARKEWSRVKTHLDRWLAFLNEAVNLDPESLPIALRKDREIVEAVAELERMGLDPNEREIYELEVNSRMIETEQLEDAEVKGRHKGKEELIVRLISRKVGAIPDDLTRKLDRLTTKELDDLGDALFDLGSYADVLAWLDNHYAQRQAGRSSS